MRADGGSGVNRDQGLRACSSFGPKAVFPPVRSGSSPPSPLVVWPHLNHGLKICLIAHSAPRTSSVVGVKAARDVITGPTSQRSATSWVLWSVPRYLGNLDSSPGSSLFQLMMTLDLQKFAARPPLSALAVVILVGGAALS